MIRKAYKQATRIQRPGQRSDYVEYMWPWQRRYFSTFFFEPRIKVRIIPEGDFVRGTISLQVFEFDPGRGIDFWKDDATWSNTDTQVIETRWQSGEERRFTLRIPSPKIPGEGTYQCRIHLDEREEVAEGEFAQLTDSYYYITDPIRVHGAAIAVALLVALAGFIGGVIGALLTGLITALLD